MRVIPITLQEHLDTGITTMTFAMRISPVAPGYADVGCTMLDRDLVFNDGLGELTYHAPISYTPSTLAATSSMGTDNGEGQHLIPEGDMGISEIDLRSGAYDYAKFRLYWLNYEDTTMGYARVLRGELGQIRVEDGMTFWSEMTSLAKGLKVPVVQKTSRTCRATFGSQPLGSSGAEFTEKFFCGKDVETLWVPETVSGVGAEANMTFSASGLTGNFNPGMVKWITGANAGRQYEVEAQSGANVTLAYPTMFPIQNGDTFDIRPDCTKWINGDNSCLTHFAADWVLHFRGEPYLKPQDSDSAITPGAGIGRGAA